MAHRRASARLVGLVAVGLAVAGCTSGSSSAARSSAPAPSRPRALAGFYDQKLHWSACGSAQCAKLLVPVDYAHPKGPTIHLAVNKIPATGHPTGSLVINPGGPGGSGIDAAPFVAKSVNGAVRSAYDVVGFDPRGVGRSAPVSCGSAADIDRYLGADPTPDTKAEQQLAIRADEALGTACRTKPSALLAHMSTTEAAKDMDVLRAALGDDKLNFFGSSYGTLLGSTYAGLFPQQVGRFVLDGVVPPDLSGAQLREGMARAREQATRAYVRDCVSQGSCPLGNSVDVGMARIRKLLKDIDAKPLPVSDEGDVTRLTEGWATLGIVHDLYAKQYWPALTSDLQQALDGNGDGLMEEADRYAGRDDTGAYASNTMVAEKAIECIDRGGSESAADYRNEARQLAKVAPTWGRAVAAGPVSLGGRICGTWPVKATGKPERITAKGSEPILVVGTTRDPATPYSWAKRLAGELSNGHLLTYAGDGHTAFGRGSTCVDDAVDHFLVDGTVPADGKRC